MAWYLPWQVLRAYFEVLVEVVTVVVVEVEVAVAALILSLIHI